MTTQASATITNDYLNDDDSDQGVVFQLVNTFEDFAPGHGVRRKMWAYDDQGLCYEVTADLVEVDDLASLLAQLSDFAGVKRLDDVTDDGEDWSVS